jgi:small subunit ribosomal protein S16
MLIMRLRRIGRKSDPHYRVVVAEHTSPVQGKFLAEVGHYHPKSKELVLNQDLILAWMEKGAQVSNTVARLCDKAGIGHERIVAKQYQGQPKKKAVAAAKAKEDKANAPAPVAEAPSEEPAVEESTEAEAPAEEAVEADAPEESVTEDVAEAAPTEEVTDETEVPVEESGEEPTADEVAASE